MLLSWFFLVLVWWFAAAVSFLGVVLAWTAKRTTKVTVILTGVLLLILTYNIGSHVGRERYHVALRSELNPFLDLIGSASRQQTVAAVKDFFLGVDAYESTPAEYLGSLRHAHNLLKNPPNQAAEPSRPPVTPPAGAGDRASGAPGSP